MIDSFPIVSFVAYEILSVPVIRNKLSDLTPKNFHEKFLHFDKLLITIHPWPFTVVY